MFLLRQVRIFPTVRFVSDEHHIHYGQHLASYGDDGFLGSMLSLDSFIELSHPGVMLSCGLRALRISAFTVCRI
jgi:hypothetical protein